MRVKNEMNEWSEYSPSLTLKTHSDENEKITKHRSFNLHHHRHHDKKHKNYLQSGSRDLNSKNRYNSYLDENSAFAPTSSFNLLMTISFMSYFLTKFYF